MNDGMNVVPRTLYDNHSPGHVTPNDTCEREFTGKQHASLLHQILQPIAIYVKC